MLFCPNFFPLNPPPLLRDLIFEARQLWRNPWSSLQFCAKRQRHHHEQGRVERQVQHGAHARERVRVRAGVQVRVRVRVRVRVEVRVSHRKTSMLLQLSRELTIFNVI